MARDLFIVDRRRPDLYDCLNQEFASDETVEVILDRRQGERRRQPGAVQPERRRRERRSYAESVSLRTLEFALISVSQRNPPVSTGALAGNGRA